MRPLEQGAQKAPNFIRWSTRAASQRTAAVITLAPSGRRSGALIVSDSQAKASQDRGAISQPSSVAASAAKLRAIILAPARFNSAEVW